MGISELYPLIISILLVLIVMFISYLCTIVFASSRRMGHKLNNIL